MDKDELQTKYNQFARWYDFGEALPEALAVRKLRRELLQKASGRVLEVAAGTGKNLSYYPRTCHITAIDLSPGMLEIARRRAVRLDLSVDFLIGDAEALPFPDESFDTVVDSLSICTFTNPIATLREMARVCRPKGRILLLEHGKSDREWLGRWQGRRAERHAEKFGCRWNLHPPALVREAGLPLRASRRRFFGIFWAMEAAP